MLTPCRYRSKPPCSVPLFVRLTLPFPQTVNLDKEATGHVLSRASRRDMFQKARRERMDGAQGSGAVRHGSGGRWLTSVSHLRHYDRIRNACELYDDGRLLGAEEFWL